VATRLEHRDGDAHAGFQLAEQSKVRGAEPPVILHTRDFDPVIDVMERVRFGAPPGRGGTR